MTLSSLIQIAQAGFPEEVKCLIKFNELKMYAHNGVYRLYHKDCPTTTVNGTIELPAAYYMSIYIGDNKFIQIDVNTLAFNHYAAIKEMEKMGLMDDCLKQVKWCHTIGCNKKATNFIDETTDVHPGEKRQVGYCYGHYVRSLTNSR